MQSTRLNLLVDGALGQFGRWLRNPWRRLSVLIISLLLGNFLATIVSTTAGQRAELDVIVAVVLVLLAELVSWLTYRSARRRREPGESEQARTLLVELLNGSKLGLIYGLFVEAFKLGS